MSNKKIINVYNVSMDRSGFTLPAPN